MTDKKAIVPEWLKEPHLAEDVQPLNNPNLNSTSVERNNNLPPSRYALIFQWISKITTMLLCVLMFGTAIIGFASISGIEDGTEKVFVATYMLFFSAMLFTFEVLQIRPVEWLDHMYRRNFGFLYSVTGKSLFIIFIAFLSYGLGEPQTLSFITGSLLAAFGCFEFGVYLKYPTLFE